MPEASAVTTPPLASVQSKYAQTDGILRQFRLTPHEETFLGHRAHDLKAWTACNLFEYRPYPETHPETRRDDIRRVLVVDSYLTRGAIFPVSNTQPVAGLAWRIDANLRASCTMGLPENAAKQFLGREEDLYFHTARKALPLRNLSLEVSSKFPASATAVATEAYPQVLEHNPFTRTLILRSIFALNQLGVEDLRIAHATREEIFAWGPWLRELNIRAGGDGTLKVSELIKSLTTTQSVGTRFDHMDQSINPFT